MTVNVWIKSAAIRYSLVATLGGALLVGCVWGSAFVWQKIDNRAREAAQEPIDAKYLPAAREAAARGDQAEADRIMQRYREAIERHYAK